MESHCYTNEEKEANVEYLHSKSIYALLFIQ